MPTRWRCWFAMRCVSAWSMTSRCIAAGVSYRWDISKMGMADDMQMLQMLRNYQLPQQPLGYQPLQLPPQSLPAQPAVHVPQTAFGLDLGTAGSNRGELRMSIDPRYWQLFYGRQF